MVYGSYRGRSSQHWSFSEVINDPSDSQQLLLCLLTPTNIQYRYQSAVYIWYVVYGIWYGIWYIWYMVYMVWYMVCVAYPVPQPFTTSCRKASSVWMCFCFNLIASSFPPIIYHTYIYIILVYSIYTAYSMSVYYHICQYSM